MSATARGIIVAAEGADLVLRATPQDVRRFTAGQPGTLNGGTVDDMVRELRGQGWQMVPTHDTEQYWQHSWFNYSAERPRAMAALLRTRCGCERLQPVENPPPQAVQVGLTEPVRFATDENGDMATLRFQLRIFERTGRAQDRDGVRVLEYMETGG